MSYIEMKEWLDRQIAWREEGKRLKEFNSQICVIDTPNERKIHVNDIDVVANLMGEELVEEDWGEYVSRSFVYEGYTVYGLVKKENVQALSD